MTTTGGSPLDLLAQALEQAAAAMSASGGSLAEAPTPCRSWNVDVLQRHLLDDLTQFRKAALGGKADFDKPVPEFEGDRGAGFRAGAVELLDAWRAQDIDAPVELPFGTVPGSFVVSQQLAEFCVHTWDLLTATGQDVSGLDPAPAEAALAWARGVLRPEFRGSEEEGRSFGPEQPAGADADAYSRLAAFFGRTLPSS